ncbi:helix-turn-helix domain-containing protein [Phenylobacterium sp.]|uniref:helix-turn-helix domain-containing protein n=1 Tax=Phenylobacterium sp. TaxID=1871053 RepID=UPI002FCA371E
MRRSAGSFGQPRTRRRPVQFICRRPNPVFSADYEPFREILIQARQSAGVSQRTLAARIGRSGSHVSMIEQGQRRIDILEFYLIVRSLGQNPTELFQRAAQRVAASQD